MENFFITNLTIKKVRHLKNISIPLSEEKVKHLILTGMNGSGKTSVVEALAKYLDKIFIGERAKDFRNCQKELDIIFNNKIDSIPKLVEKYHYILAYYGADRIFQTEQPKHVEKVKLKDYYGLTEFPRIVLIDEIDTHLHLELQKSIKLILMQKSLQYILYYDIISAVVSRDIPLLQMREHISIKNVKIYKEDTQMNEIIKAIEDEQLKSEITEFGVGDTIKVFAKVIEGTRERIQVFEGTVIKRQNSGVRETFTVRKFSNGVGVEKTWPLHSPIIDKIEVVRKGKVRRAKLFYLRDRVGKAAKVKEVVR